MKVMKKRFLFITFVLIFTLIFTGCNSGNTTQPADKSAELSKNDTPQALKGNHFELLQKQSDKILKSGKLSTISAQEVYEKVVLEGDQSYFVVDVRAAADFAAGHIEGAVNIPYSLTAKPNMIANLPKDKKIVVACYSGHTAGQTAMLWNMIGYDAVPLLNGMGGWKKGAGTALPEKAFDFPVVTEMPKAEAFGLPSFKVENAADIQALILSRSQNYLESGKGPVVNAPTLKEKVLDGQDANYYLVDIREAKDYGKGHIAGSINIPAQTIAELDNLKKLPIDKKIVLIGYQGADASAVSRILNQLGYDSYALLQGMRVWTSDAEVNGIAPVSSEVIINHPVKKLNYDLQGGGGSASCS